MASLVVVSAAFGLLAAVPERQDPRTRAFVTPARAVRTVNLCCQDYLCDGMLACAMLPAWLDLELAERRLFPAGYASCGEDRTRRAWRHV